LFHVKHLSELIESYFSKMLFSTKSLKSLIILSAYAEDHGLCPWMNADFVAKSFLCPWVNATADNPPKPWHLRRSVSTSMGVGGYFMEVPQALPVGLHCILFPRAARLNFERKCVRGVYARE
jgi:hypothetical protein